MYVGILREREHFVKGEELSVGQSQPDPTLKRQLIMNTPPKIRALIVEDDTLVGEMIQGLLEELGYAVIGKAHDGAEAVELTRSLQPDVVLMDIEMPGISGIEATRQIFQQCPTPVVMITAHATVDTAVEALKTGAFDYLTKPFDQNEVRNHSFAAEAFLERRVL